MGLTLDASALRAAGKNNRRVWTMLHAAQREGMTITVPAPVLTMCAGEDWMFPYVGELLSIANVEQTSPELALHASSARRRSGVEDPVQALVMCGAAVRSDVVLSTNPWELLPLSDDLGGVRLVSV